MKLSVVVLNWNGIKYLRNLFLSIRQQTFQNFEVIFVDNGSNDGSQEFVRINYPQVRIIQNSENLGFCKANNQGVLAAKGEYVCLLNNDMILGKNFFKELVNALDKNPSWTAVWGKSFDKYGKKDYTFPGFGTTTVLGHCTVLPFLDKNSKEPQDVFGVSGNTMTFRNRGVPPFLDEYFIYSEDAYFSFRTRLFGGTIKKIPTAVCWHEGEQAMKHISGHKAFLQHRNRQMNLLIFYSLWTLIRIAPLVLIENLVSMMYRWRNIHNLLYADFWLVWNWKFWWKQRKIVQNKSVRRVKDSELLKYMSSRFVDKNDVPHLAKPFAVLLNLISYLWCKLTFIRTWEMRV